MTTDIQLDKIQQICEWMLIFCLEKSVQAFREGDLYRVEAFSRVAIVVLGCLQEDG